MIFGKRLKSKSFNAKSKLQSLALTCLLSISAIMPAVSHADTVSSRSTGDYVKVRDYDGAVTAKFSQIGSAGEMTLTLNETDLNYFRGGSATSRLSSCAVSPSSTYNTDEAAISAVGNCFSEAVYQEIERDLKYLLENSNSKVAYYNYIQPLRVSTVIRDSSGTRTETEDRKVTASVLMRAGDGLGESTRMGLSISPRSSYQHLYVKYEQADGFGLIEGETLPNAGDARVYTLENPADLTNKTYYKTIPGNFDEPDAYGDPNDPNTSNKYNADSGLLKLITKVGDVMAETGSESAIIDYGRRVQPKYNESGGGNLDIEHLKIDINDRYFYKNECTARGVWLGQDNSIELLTDYQRDRYWIINPSLTKDPISLGQIPTQFDIDVSDDPAASAYQDKMITVNNKDVHKGYSYNTSFSDYLNDIADPIGDWSNAPNNLFRIGNEDPYNNIPFSYYGNVADLRNEMICEITYLEKYVKEAGYWKQVPVYGTIPNCRTQNGAQVCNPYTAIVGYESVWEEPVYGKREAQSCILNSEVDNFCSGNRECLDKGTECDIAITGESSYQWDVSSWSGCSEDCGEGRQYRTVMCIDSSTGIRVSDGKCSGSKPSESQVCQSTQACNYNWETSNWTACNATCEADGTQTRDVYCLRSDGSTVSNSNCYGAGSEPQWKKSCSVDRSTCFQSGCFYDEKNYVYGKIVYTENLGGCWGCGGFDMISNGGDVFYGSAFGTEPSSWPGDNYIYEKHTFISPYETIKTTYSIGDLMEESSYEEPPHRTIVEFKHEICRER